ncbi:hypothetical protein EK21DRAFT_94402 [Setomelanomma holmii]|uniref:Uncharacterized protein n=1 Tax=Setomelanomma holmii TaxID=210430 RepID=A0A9P4GYW4_9PLEO|nr:hypothetical protein EK21DRAFT_94402 [Setomelanomma holmii]
MLKDPLDNDLGECYRLQLTQLSAWGFKTLTEPWELEASDSFAAIARPRRVGGKQNLTIDLDTTGIIPTDGSDTAALEVSTSKIEQSGGVYGDRDLFDRCTMNAAVVFNHGVLKRAYVSVTDTSGRFVGLGEMRKGSYSLSIKALKKKVDNVTRLESVKLHEDQRPEEYDEYWDPSLYDRRDAGLHV